MALLRRVGGGVVFVLAILSLLGCLAGAVGAWYAKATVDATSLAAIDMVAGYVGLAGQTIANVDGGLADAEQSVANLKAAVANLRS
jgi:hypothetical protein